MKYNSLGDRMKGYENVSRIYLTRRMPLIIRIDGNAFHTFTKGFAKPFDPIFMQAMQETMQKLCEKIQGCKVGYTQSDEISLLLIDYDNLDTDAWFDKNLQKTVSISASIATMEFNGIFSRLVRNRAWGDCEIQPLNRLS
jgi:tRNA(His) 5'-end guanylyltransferase